MLGLSPYGASQGKQSCVNVLRGWNINDKTTKFSKQKIIENSSQIMEVNMEKSVTSQVVIIGFFFTTHNYLAVSKASYKIRMSRKYNLPMATHSAVNSPNKYVCISHLEFSLRRILHPALYDWCISGRRGIALWVIFVSRGSVCSHLPGRIPSLVGKIGSNICKKCQTYQWYYVITIIVEPVICDIVTFVFQTMPLSTKIDHHQVLVYGFRAALL